MKKNILLLLLLCLGPAGFLQAQVAVKIKDVTRVAGIRDNQLVGYGLVIGLNGRGDSQKSKITRDTAANLFQKFNIRVDPADIISRNIAAVIVTAVLPSFCEPGSRIDVKVASVGDARSIENGELLQTALLAADGKIYAVVQGTVVTVYKDGNDVFGKMTSGYIPNGGMVERATDASFVEAGTIRILAEQPDFTTVRNIVTAVNERFGGPVASARDNASVALALPAEYAADITRFLAEVGELEIEPGATARVVIDRRSGTVVMGGEVKVSAVAVSQKKMNIEIGPSPASFLDEFNERRNTRASYALEEAADVKSIVEGLNRMGARTEDVISIMRALKAAGALHAQLIIL